ncbi:MAG: hypothetical protein ACKVQB_02415 [Bacteroidia bacterium]
MNKKLKLIILSLLFVASTQAQEKKIKEKPKKLEEKGNSVLGVHAGLSLTGLLYDADKDSDSIKFIANSKPAFQVTFDNFYSNKITFGFFGSIQPFRVDISYWEYDTINPKRIEDSQAKMKRIYIGGRVLYHYKNTSKVDIYSGVRAGVLFWNKKLPSADPEFVSSFKDEFPMYNLPRLGIIPIGLRVKFSPQFSANFELSTLSPHLFSFGACYTLTK